MIRVVRRFISLSLLLMSGIGLAAPATARPPGPPAHDGEPLEHLVETLGLDEAALSKVYQIIDASRANQRELRRKHQDAHQQMRTLLEQETPDEAAVMTQADAVGALRTEMQKHRLRTILQIRALLTPEQRAKLLETLRTRYRHGRLKPPPPPEEP